MVPFLSTNRLLLQEIKPVDQAFIFQGLSHPGVIPFYGTQYVSFDATAKQMEWYQRMVLEGWGIPWKIVNKSTGLPMGVISVYYYKPEHKKAEVGFWLLPDYWNNGFAYEALTEVLHYWEQVKDLHRMEAFVEEGNISSRKLLERAGFVYEGFMRDCEIKNEKYIGLHIYARLKTDIIE